MSRSVGLNHKISLFLKETLAGTSWLYKVIILFYNTTLKMLQNDQSLWEGIIVFIICGISSSCHSYSTATWNSCSAVQRQRQRICWSLSQAIRAYLSRESSLNWMDPMYFLTTDSSFVGAVYLGQSRCFITVPQKQIEALWSSTSSAFHSSLLENSGVSNFESHGKGRRDIF